MLMLQLQLETGKEHPRDVLPSVPHLIPSTFTSSITHLITLSPLLLPCLPRRKNKKAVFLPSREVCLREGLIPEEARHDTRFVQPLPALGRAGAGEGSHHRQESPTACCFSVSKFQRFWKEHVCRPRPCAHILPSLAAVGCTLGKRDPPAPHWVQGRLPHNADA